MTFLLLCSLFLIFFYIRYEPKLDTLVFDDNKTIILWYNKKPCIRTYIKIYTYYIT